MHFVGSGRGRGGCPLNGKGFWGRREFLAELGGGRRDFWAWSTIMPMPEPKNLREACQDPAYAMVLEHLVEKADPEDLMADLVKDGKGEEEAARIVNRGKLLLKQAARERGSVELVVGILLLVFGAGITLLTLLSALGTGGYVVICHGAILVGIAFIARAIRHRKSTMRGWLRREVAASIDEAQRPQEMGDAPEGRRLGKERTYDY
jgi:hypothetical protein